MKIIAESSSTRSEWVLVEGNQILESLKLDESVRAEKLTLENFADITNRILKKGI